MDTIYKQPTVLDSNQPLSESFPLTQGSGLQDIGCKVQYDSECTVVLTCKHLAGNLFKVRTPCTPLITDAPTLERRVPQGSLLQRHDSLSKLKPYLAAQGLKGRSFLMVCRVERQMAVSEVLLFHDALLCDRA